MSSCEGRPTLAEGRPRPTARAVFFAFSALTSVCARVYRRVCIRNNRVRRGRRRGPRDDYRRPGRCRPSPVAQTKKLFPPWPGPPSSPSGPGRGFPGTDVLDPQACRRRNTMTPAYTDQRRFCCPERLAQCAALSVRQERAFLLRGFHLQPSGQSPGRCRNQGCSFLYAPKTLVQSADSRARGIVEP